MYTRGNCMRAYVVLYRNVCNRLSSAIHQFFVSFSSVIYSYCWDYNGQNKKNGNVKSLRRSSSIRTFGARDEKKPKQSHKSFYFCFFFTAYVDFIFPFSVSFFFLVLYIFVIYVYLEWWWWLSSFFFVYFAPQKCILFLLLRLLFSTTYRSVVPAVYCYILYRHFCCSLLLSFYHSLSRSKSLNLYSLCFVY